MLKYLLLLILFALAGMEGSAQRVITGQVFARSTSGGLAYVNLGIKKKNIGTTSDINGSFTITLPSGFIRDTLTFSLVGYKEVQVPVTNFKSGENTKILMDELVSQLAEVKVTSKRSVEKRFGIKNRNGVDDLFPDGYLFKKWCCIVPG